MPMLYMPDCLNAVISLMEAPRASLRSCTYNLTGFSFTPAELAESIKHQLPSFQIQYKPDFRQQIADSWPRSIDDSNARRDWGWNPQYNIHSMTKDMLAVLSEKYKK